MKKKKIILLVGIPGSGKSTYFKNHFGYDKPDVAYINADSVRLKLYGDENIQGNGKQVFDIIYGNFLNALINDAISTIVVDNTNISFKSRQKFYELIENNCTMNTAIELIFFENFELAKERNTNRDRVVPDEVMDRMISNFQGPTVWELKHANVKRV